jgi:outer membrane protein OmpA-like peptidoglycan-associated protein
MAREKCDVVTLGAVALLVLGSAGCLATHKYVQTQVTEPLQGNIKAVDKKVDSKTAELDQRISDVDRNAERQISDVNTKAETADKNAQKADQDAQSAQQTGEKGVNMATQTQHQLENIDNYQAVKTQDVLFGFNKADLTDDDKQQLDSLNQTLSSLKHYAIEVEGFTDKTGTQRYNLELSQRRADAVVRYLTENEKVPLVKIHMLGLGEDQPAGDNKTKDGRKQNRRVEVRIMAPEMGQQAATNQ